MANQHYEISRRPVSSRNLKRLLMRVERDLRQIHGRIPDHNEFTAIDVGQAIRYLEQARRAIISKPRSYVTMDIPCPPGHEPHCSYWRSGVLTCDCGYLPPGDA